MKALVIRETGDDPRAQIKMLRVLKLASGTMLLLAEAKALELEMSKTQRN